MSEKTMAKIEKLAEKGKEQRLVSLASSKDAEVRAAAAKALGCSKKDDGYNALLSLLHDADAQVRLNAVAALGEVGRDSAAEHIRHLMAASDDPAFGDVCKQALASIRQKSRAEE